MLETIHHLIANKKNPSLELIQMLAHLPYVFAPNSVLLTRTAEIVCHDDRGHPKAFKPLLTSTLLLAYPPNATAQEVN